MKYSQVLPGIKESIARRALSTETPTGQDVTKRTHQENSRRKYSKRNGKKITTVISSRLENIHFTQKKAGVGLNNEKDVTHTENEQG